MAEDTGSGDPRERITAKRSAGVAALVAAGLAAGALAAGSLASGATADVGRPHDDDEHGSGRTTTDTTTTDTTTTTTDTTTTDTTTTDHRPTTTTTTTDPARRRRPRRSRPTPVEPPPAVEPPAAARDHAAAPSPSTPPAPAPRRRAACARERPRRRPSRPPTRAPEADASSRRRTPARARPRPSSRRRRLPPPAPAQPALSARLLPTPAQIRFYVHATSTPPLPKLRTIDHDLALRVSTIASEAHVHWALLAAVARVESRLGAAKGPIAGKRLPTVPEGEADQLRALAAFLRENGANRNLSAKVTQDALKAYFGPRRPRSASARWPRSTARSASGACSTASAGTAASCASACCSDRRLHIYPGGRADIRGRRVDPRVLITMEYLANATGSVRVSSLVSGHRLFTAAGSVSAHVYGRAVDVTAVGGVRIKRHQGPGSVTERTVRLLLLLPQRMRPRQVVSLMDVDGPTGNRGSFALPDHSDRIQIGY